MLLIKEEIQSVSYEDALKAMQDFTAKRAANTQDEIWFCEHPPVFTLGRHADPSHILNPHNIPVIKSDRGGQVTYHGPGQLLVYFLLDLKRKKMGVAELVCRIEKTVIQVLQEFGIKAQCDQGRPGVYVLKDNKLNKICSLGLRVKNGYTYHGLALNINMDLKPFSYINPCGYKDLAMTQISEFIPGTTVEQVKQKIQQTIKATLFDR